LVVGAKPADEAALFFFGAGVVEGDEALEEFLFDGFGYLAATNEEFGTWQGSTSGRSVRMGGGCIGKGRSRWAFIWLTHPHLNRADRHGGSVPA
jgi:hypothetical protein